MSAPLTIAQASDLVDLSIQKVFMKTSDPEAKFKSYFNFRTTMDELEKDSSLSGLSEADKKTTLSAVNLLLLMGKIQKWTTPKKLVSSLTI